GLRQASPDGVLADTADTAAAAADGAHVGAQSASGAAVAADHLAEVVRVHPALEHASAAQVARGDLHIVRVVDDALHEVLESLLEHAQASVGSDAEESAAASSFLSAFFFWVMASPLASSSPPIASKDGRAAFPSGWRSGAGAGSPLNFCQSPVFCRMARTASVGWAPTPSQYATRSLAASITDGLYVGWYLPISSMARPSRRVRASATTMR